MTDEWLAALAPAAQRELLLEIIELSAATADLRAMADRAAVLVARVSGTDRCVVHVLDDSGRRLVVAGGWPAGNGSDAEVLPIGSGLAGWVASHGRPAVSVDLGRDTRGADGSGTGAAPYASSVSAPVGIAGSAPCGVVSVFTTARCEFTADQVAGVVGVGRLLGPSLTAARHHQDMHTRELSRSRGTEDFVSLQESDRRRLAAEVHDGVGQRIVGLSFHLAAAAESLADQPDFAAEQLATARELAELAQAEVRSAVYGVRPPLLDDLGLADALASLGRRVPGLDVDVRVTDQVLSDPALADHVATSLYRIAQEALQNVAKHAAAGRATVELFPAGQHVVLRITDDGDGFDPAARTEGHGLTNMRERAELVGGRLDLVSRRGGGTTLSVRIPPMRPHPHPAPG